jgi:hypothetical protein
MGTMVYAQTPTSAQSRQSAQQLLNQSQSKSQQFEATQVQLSTDSMNNQDAATYLRLKTEVERLEGLISAAQEQLKTNLDTGSLSVQRRAFSDIDRLIFEHKKVMADLEAFINEA